MLTYTTETDGVRRVTDEDELNSLRYESVQEELMKTGVCFPGRPAHSIIDRKLFMQKLIDACTKKYTSATSKQGAGVVCFWCANHGCCLGWVFLTSAESCEVVFTTLVTRFQVMPKVIVYDNGCNLSDYCLNRAPALFNNTIFLVDAFHYKSHVNCSLSFNSKLSGCMNGKASVMHEIKNSVLAKNKVPSMYMRFDTFIYMFDGLIAAMNSQALATTLL